MGLAGNEGWLGVGVVRGGWHGESEGGRDGERDRLQGGGREREGETKGKKERWRVEGDEKEVAHGFCIFS